jgi:hypothetical protein
LSGLPESQAARAKQRLEEALDRAETVVVTDLAVGEAYYALHDHYGGPKPEASDVLLRFVSSGVVMDSWTGSFTPVIVQRAQLR